MSSAPPPPSPASSFSNVHPHPFEDHSDIGGFTGLLVDECVGSQTDQQQQGGGRRRESGESGSISGI